MLVSVETLLRRARDFVYPIPPGLSVVAAVFIPYHLTLPLPPTLLLATLSSLASIPTKRLITHTHPGPYPSSIYFSSAWL